jgi:hypothetical protein
MFIHHETISAKHGDPHNGRGCFDVIEESDGFKVFDSGASMWVQRGPFATLDEASALAQRCADRWDAANA